MERRPSACFASGFPGLVIQIAIFVALVGCGPSSTGEPEPSPEAEPAVSPASEGEVGGPCYTNDTCNGSYVCTEGLCAAPAGTLLGPCRADGTPCNEGLVCESAACIPVAPDPSETVLVEADKDFVEIGEAFVVSVQTAAFSACEVVHETEVLADIEIVDGHGAVTVAVSEFREGDLAVRCPRTVDPVSSWVGILDVVVGGFALETVSASAVAVGSDVTICGEFQNVDGCEWVHTTTTTPLTSIESGCFEVTASATDRVGVIECDVGDRRFETEVPLPEIFDLMFAYNPSSTAVDPGTNLGFTWVAPAGSSSCSLYVISGGETPGDAELVAADVSPPYLLNLEVSGTYMVECMFEEQTVREVGVDAVIVRPKIFFEYRPPFELVDLASQYDFSMYNFDDISLADQGFGFEDWVVPTLVWSAAGATTCTLESPEGISVPVDPSGTLELSNVLDGNSVGYTLTCANFSGDEQTVSRSYLAGDINLDHLSSDADIEMASMTEAADAITLLGDIVPGVTEDALSAFANHVRSVGTYTVVGSATRNLSSLKYVGEVLNVSSPDGAGESLDLGGLIAAPFVNATGLESVRLGGDIQLVNLGTVQTVKLLPGTRIDTLVVNSDLQTMLFEASDDTLGNVVVNVNQIFVIGSTGLSSILLDDRISFQGVEELAVLGNPCLAPGGFDQLATAIEASPFMSFRYGVNGGDYPCL